MLIFFDQTVYMTTDTGVHNLTTFQYGTHRALPQNKNRHF